MPICRAGDVRLTMGGEPTFVSIDDLESPEWNIAAVGPTKQALADELIRKLHARFAPGGLLHYGQGKWYPGESLPRWAFGLYWRKDGVPIWKNADLIAKIENPRKADDRGRRKLSWKAPRSGSVSIAEYVMPAYEDPAHWLQKEAALPINVDPSDSKLADAEERSRMARVFDEGLNKPRGFVLPIQHADADAKDRRGLDERALAAAARPSVPDAGRFAARAAAADGVAAACPARRISLHRRAGSDGAAARTRGRRRGRRGRQRACEAGRRSRKPKPKPVRTAMSVEIRDGVLCVFMPPVEKLEDYLELIAAVEATAEELQIQVHVEGYGPPYDPRVEVIKVTPDPGVIEVNVQPAQNWREAVDITFGLYEDAAQSPARRQPISWSTAATPAPAAAIMSWSAAPRRRIRRSCAAPIC